MEYALTVILILVAILLIDKVLVRHLFVYEYEQGIKYTRGKFVKILLPGSYWYLPYYSHVEKMDTRLRYTAIAGQEILSADGVGLKISAAVAYQIADVYKAAINVQNINDAVYTEIQIALREIVGAVSIDELLQNRNQISVRLIEITQEKLQTFGLSLITANIKDIMFPGQLKQMFAQVEQARKEGQAALERARGETAALRNLANAAKMLEKSPTLMQLRLLQSIGESKGNTFIIGMPSQFTPVPVQGGEIASTDTPKIDVEPDI